MQCLISLPLLRDVALEGVSCQDVCVVLKPFGFEEDSEELLRFRGNPLMLVSGMH